MTDEQKYRYACWLYYLGLNEDEQSPLSDYEFDQLRIKLGYAPDESYQVPYTMTDKEIEAARVWAKG
jgi:hypothetical protein